jgi:hypothetical protein
MDPTMPSRYTPAEHALTGDIYAALVRSGILAEHDGHTMDTYDRDGQVEAFVTNHVRHDTTPDAQARLEAACTAYEHVLREAGFDVRPAEAHRGIYVRRLPAGGPDAPWINDVTQTLGNGAGSPPATPDQLAPAEGPKQRRADTPRRRTRAKRPPAEPTQGPCWTVRVGTSQERMIQVVGRRKEVPVVLALVPDADDPEQEANAHLYAIAPELLEYVRRITKDAAERRGAYLHADRLAIEALGDLVTRLDERRR